MDTSFILDHKYKALKGTTVGHVTLRMEGHMTLRLFHYVFRNIK